MKNRARRLRCLPAILGLAAALAALPLIAAAQDTAAPGAQAAALASTTDHGKLKPLQRDFASGPEVTRACLECHTEAGDQVMHSIHFTWEFEQPATGQILGKRHVINSFCGNVVGNEARCTSCHAGYGWEDMHQAPAAAVVTPDCLVCHDRSGQYTKTATGAGHPPLAPVPEGMQTITGAKAWAVDLTRAAQSVGLPGRDNCGNCHFYGGGGDNVKHGDLSSALFDPPRAIDVHMSPQGEDFTCATCHVSDRHQWPGSRYNLTAVGGGAPAKPGAPRRAASCQSCHTDTPHEASIIGLKLDDHTDTLACQSCHIPAFARGGVATKTFWDWSTAGRLDEEGRALAISDYLEADGDRRDTYLSTKGDFDWGENVPPVYAWFNGAVEYTTADRQVDPTAPVEINPIHGTPDGADSRIWPFKRMEGRQPYDSEMNELVYTHVWGPGTDTALWSNFDWARAIRAGMEAANEPYSGSYGFVDTYMYWPITHMVAPATDALRCGDCHAASGRMTGLSGINLPGTRPFSAAGIAGMGLVLVTLGGVLVHAGLRLIGRRRREGGHG